jgi:hypothetical protein
MSDTLPQSCPGVIPELTDTEFELLMIAREGEFIALIGDRVTKALERLVGRGLMRKLDDVNYVITRAGRIVVNDAENQSIIDYINLSNKAYHARNA